MPDITMCNNPHCRLRGSCFTALAVPHPTWQSYAEFKLEMVDGREVCDHYRTFHHGDRILLPGNRDPILVSKHTKHL